jgi:methanogenic corrinoid protein MtbC1
LTILLKGYTSTNIDKNVDALRFLRKEESVDKKRRLIWPGRSVCTQDWADSIGADGYAEDAARAVKLVENLMSQNG